MGWQEQVWGWQVLVLVCVWWWQGAARCGQEMQTADTLDTGGWPPAPSTLISTDTTLSRAGQVLLLPSVCKEGQSGNR